MKFNYTEACEISILFGALQQYPLCMTFAQAQEALEPVKRNCIAKSIERKFPLSRIEQASGS